MTEEIETYEAKGNVHLDVSTGQNSLPFHEVVGQLAAKYAGNNGRVLDVGCGMGESLSHALLANPSIQASAADAYPTCLDNARALFELKEALLMDESGFEIPTDLPGVYDVLILSHVLEHTYSPREAIAECMRVLKPGGHLVLAVPNPVRPDVLLSSIKRRDYVNRGHAYAWDRSHFINFLERILGLEVVEYASDEVKVFPRRLVDRFAALAHSQRSLANSLPWLSFSNIAVIRKEAV